MEVFGRSILACLLRKSFGNETSQMAILLMSFRFLLTKCRKKVRKVEVIEDKVPKDHYKTMFTWRNSKKLFLDNFFEKNFEKIALSKKFLKKIYSHFYPRNPDTMGGGLTLWGGEILVLLFFIKKSVVKKNSEIQKFRHYFRQYFYLYSKWNKIPKT